MARKPVPMNSSGESDGLLEKITDKIGELFAGLKSTNTTVGGIDSRLEAVEKDLAARPTFSPAAINRASGKLDKMEIK